ncbi:MAG: alpha/beta hydrolase, partial [Firmicutes bacterium]|nr:alpha/beta hydrolase [Bacillota bacterium]
DAMLDYAAELYRQVPIVLYGHSMGGNICLDYRARGEKNALPEKYIVSAPWIKLVANFPKPVVAALKGLAKIMPKMTISQKIDESTLGNLEYVRPYADDPLVHNKISLQCAAQCFDFGNNLYDGVHEDSHRADGKPFLLMHGDADAICAVEGSRKVAERMTAFDWFTYEELPGYYHEIHNGGPDVTGDEVIARIAAFVLE